MIKCFVFLKRWLTYL
jgi:ribulose-5-phosphate 4-epimerase/fuculose-1-phosphate aldolase